MDFEQWIRSQLAAGSERSSPRPAPTPPPEPLGRLTPGFQILAAVISVTVIAVGLSSIGNLQPVQIHVLAQSGHTLPVETWAGVPPPPADHIPAVSEAPSSPSPLFVSAPAPTGTSDGVATGATPSPTPSNVEAERNSPTPGPPASSPAPTPSSPLSTATATFTLKGGTVTASCQNGRISVDSATPGAGVRAEVDRKEGGRVIEVRFRSDAFRSELEVWCSAGLVQSQIHEDAT